MAPVVRFRKNKIPVLNTQRLRLRLPETGDHSKWSQLRLESRAFLEPWEPAWADNHLTRDAFFSRVEWAESAAIQLTGLSFLLERREDNEILGAITLDQIEFGPSKSGKVGYWMGARFTRQGYMKEAIQSLVHHAFTTVGISRIEAACVPDNNPSRRLLENVGFKYEGVAQSYLEVAGRWRTHVLYANLRHDRRGRTDAD